MDPEFHCPQCAGTQWLAVEQFSSLTPCTIEFHDGEMEVCFDVRAEHVREAATSVTLAYTCATQECGFTIPASELTSKGGAHGNG